VTAPVARRTPAVVWVLGGLVALAMVGLAFLLYQRYGPSPVPFQVRTYEITGDREVRVSWEVSVEPGSTALCLVRARDATGADAGSRVVRVGPASERALRPTYALATTSRPVLGEVVRCLVAAPGQEPDAPVASLAAGRADRSAQ